jgi:signal peptidase II
LRKIFLTALILIFFDQALKIWIKTNMFLGQEYRVFDWFIIHFTENNGMAFGLEFGGYIGKALLTIFRIIIVIIGIKYLFSLKSKIFTSGIAIAIGLILGGAIGNIIDSCFYGIIFNDSYNNVASFCNNGGGYAPFLHGKVVDMLYFPIINTHINGSHFIFFRPVFNLADSGITIGLFIILLFYRDFFD